MTTLPLNVCAVVAARSEVGDRLRNPGDAVIIERDAPRWMLLKCPCGCGEVIPVNLDARAGKAWRLYRREQGSISLFPSVWRDTGCESHFIIWRSNIYLFDTHHEDEGRGSYSGFLELVATVERIWPPRAMTAYVEVADALQEIPWDVLDACRQLVRKGVLVEGRQEQRGHFQRR